MIEIKAYRGHIRNHRTLCETLGIDRALPRAQREEAILVRAYETYGDKGEFMMLDLTDGYNGEDQPAVEAFIAENGYSFPVYFDLDAGAAVAYGVRSIPTTVLVGSDGTLLHTQMGAMSESQIEQLMQSLLAS